MLVVMITKTILKYENKHDDNNRNTNDSSNTNNNDNERTQ